MMSMYKGKINFDREQLIFMAMLPLECAMNDVYNMMPDSTSMQIFKSDEKNIRNTSDGIAGSANYQLAILWAQLNDDGIDEDGIDHVTKFRKFVKDFVDRCATGWRAQPGETIFPDVRPIAVKVVNKLFAEYLDSGNR